MQLIHHRHMIQAKNSKQCFHLKTKIAKIMYCRSSSLFVFSILDPKQNASFWHCLSLLTAVSDTVLYDLSHGTHCFALHGSFFNHFLTYGVSSTANQILWNKWLLKLPWKAKPRVPYERAYKTVSETSVRSDPAFCLGPSIEKTNSDMRHKL